MRLLYFTVLPGESVRRSRAGEVTLVLASLFKDGEGDNNENGKLSLVMRRREWYNIITKYGNAKQDRKEYGSKTEKPVIQK